ncbi:MAG: TIGR03905 family TSCPD domain-containing protein [Clostridiales bacterium]|nr:TIGR03905 family TSCPD domain-containing protein [Clostridiales bacterium]MDD7035035.1 TIGR03905 family TSCPD domain-containing protein [Bacillota bacterium]MDY2920360.1 TIGR03905 family TSCPD domain-containing protein [Lentihominibacter sp.]
MKHEYVPQGVCPMLIEFELDGDVVHNISFMGGCNGNLKAISTLVDGWTVGEITEKLAGNTCGFKKTSCADQLCIALNQALEEEK